ncbi:caspase recruitment domain-containing protein 10 [Scleropages formosus]|uniref:caspase recruitment domain-containing protein 10 n=1 Tax=Scleropages formosus TaxID=113540 RepID=UPI0010FAB3AA|nr:caspase recruitment domain-containing protein 10-like [Scleropages formosus]
MSEWVSTDNLEEDGGQQQSSGELDEELWDRVEGVRHKLTRILNPAKLTPFLRQCKAIDEQDEDEVLNSTQYPLRISKAGRLLDILRGRGQRGLQAFMECLEFYHPGEYTQLTGRRPTQRCSMLVDEEGPEGLTQFLLLEVRKLREQLRSSRQCERRLSQRCRVAEEERSHAERRVQELRHDFLQLERMRQDWEAGSRELCRLKDRHLEQAVKYSRALEEQGKASGRERELLGQLEELKNRLMEAEKQAEGKTIYAAPVKTESRASFCPVITPTVPELPCIKTPREAGADTQALLDILQQDRREAAEQRQELCSTITRLQGELESTEAHRDKLVSQCEQLRVKVRTLQLDWETEQKRSVSYFNQIMELERERDQALRSRDSLQLEYTDCLLDKDRLRKQVIELQASLDALKRDRELERERQKEEELAREKGCPHCSHLCPFSNDHCYELCCSLRASEPDMTMCGSPLSDGSHRFQRKTRCRGQTSELSEGSFSNSDENLVMMLEDSEKDINRLSTFAFPPCVNSISRRVNTEFDLDSWGSDENLTAGGQSEISLSDSCSSLNSHCFPPDLIHLPPISPHGHHVHASRPELLSPSHNVVKRNVGTAADITIVGGNRTGIFVHSVKAGSPAEQYGLREGSELLELDRVHLDENSIPLSKCTSEVAHFSLQWWTEPSALRHQLNTEAYSRLCAQMSCSSYTGADSFYVRVNLDLDGTNDNTHLQMRCDDIMYVTDTLYNGRYQWRCTRVDTQTAEHLQVGAMPNYNRAQQLLLVRLRTMTTEKKDCKKKSSKKCAERVRLVKAVTPSCQGFGAAPLVLFTLNHRQEENLIPYSLVEPVVVTSRRPVIFSPSVLSRGLIERLLQPADSGLDFNTCHPEPISTADQRDKRVFLLSPQSTETVYGIRVESIQDVISQDKHCLLELGVSSVEGLLRQGIYPIVIHIRPKDKKGRKFKKFLSGHSDDMLMEEVCQMDEFQLENLPMLHYTLQPGTWGCTEELLAVIRNAIHSQQRAVVWVEPDRLQ